PAATPDTSPAAQLTPAPTPAAIPKATHPVPPVTTPRTIKLAIAPPPNPPIILEVSTTVVLVFSSGLALTIASPAL
ncbi:TPA: hypothetical protein NJW64_003611, partial [Acinetobacter baumannii]|nr:hypothetical protein [Acinetobacter baumannii]